MKLNLHPRRVLIVRLTALGDVLVTLPALSALRGLFPQARIAWAVEPPAHELLEGHPHLDDVILVNRRPWQRRMSRPWSLPSAVRHAVRCARELSDMRFDLAVDFQGNLRSGVVTLASRAPFRLGFGRRYTREWAHRFTNAHFTPSSDALHRADLALSLVRILGDVPSSVPPLLPEFRQADVELETQFIEQDLPRDFILLHPGTSPFGAFKRWPLSNFGILALRRRADLQTDFLVSWGSGEKEIAETVVRASRGAAHLAPELPTLRHMAELIRRSKAFVAADTGPLQLAWALGKPLVGLYGPKDPELHAPRGPHCRILTADVPCRPCTKRRCKDPICMTQITIDSVFQSLAELPAQPTPP